MADIPSIFVDCDWREEPSNGHKCDYCEIVVTGKIWRLYFTIGGKAHGEDCWLCSECADNPH